MMIDNDIQLKELALTRGGEETYSKAKAAYFKEHHRKAKTQLNRAIVMGCTDPASEHQLAANVMDGKEGPMTLNQDLIHLGDIAGLRKLLYSDSLYCDPIVHKKWVGLFASGVISKNKKRARPSDTLSQMVDIDYEAHARYEMYSRLSYQGYKHGYTAADLTERAKGFRIVRKLMRKDRLDNLEAAEKKRLSGVVDTDGSVAKHQMLGSGGLADTTDDESDNF